MSQVQILPGPPSLFLTALFVDEDGRTAGKMKTVKK